jgi:hypothetical protein
VESNPLLSRKKDRQLDVILYEIHSVVVEILDRADKILLRLPSPIPTSTVSHLP